MDRRRVMLLIEVETDIPIRELRDKKNSNLQVYSTSGLTLRDIQIIQIQANVIKTKKKGRK